MFTTPEDVSENIKSFACCPGLKLILEKEIEIKKKQKHESYREHQVQKRPSEILEDLHRIGKNTVKMKPSMVEGGGEIFAKNNINHHTEMSTKVD